MGFQQGLSGLNLSAKSLDAIGNNVANSNTVGFKSAAANFGDVFAASLAGGGASQVGIGGSVLGIVQQFTQGNVTATNNPLDLAINGNGFFRMSNNGVITYTRNGQFQVDKSGYIVNGSGLRLTGYGVDSAGNPIKGAAVDLQMDTAPISPTATTAAEVQLNLDSRNTAPTAMTHGTITGSATPATLTITAANNTFAIQVDGQPTAGPVNIDIPIGTYTTAAALATAVQTAINTNPTIVGQNTLVDVSVNTNNKVVITSRSVGSVGSLGLGSSVALSAVAGDTGLTNLMGAAPVSVAGADQFSGKNALSYTASTAQTVYDSLGNTHNLTMYFAKTAEPNTWQLYTSLDDTFTGVQSTTPATAGSVAGTGFTSSANLNAGGNFSISIDGSAAQTVYLPANPNYNLNPAPDPNSLPVALQAAIDAKYPGPAPAPTATVSVSSGHLVITSNSTGGSSSVVVAAAPTTIPARTTNELFSQASPIVAGTFAGTYNANSADAGGTLTITLAGGSPTLVTIPAGTYTTAAQYAAALQTGVNQAFGAGVVSVQADVPGPGDVTIDTVASGNLSSISDGAQQTLGIASLFNTLAPTVVSGAAQQTTTTPTPTLVSFNTAGALTTKMPLTQSYTLTNGAGGAGGTSTILNFTLDFTGTSQYGMNFGVNQLLQDGYASGRLSGISVSSDGVIQGRYSNGKSRNMGQLLLASFNNANGLQSLGGNQWAETVNSGQPIPGTPGGGSLGVIQSASVEESNVDLTAELVAMITQQRIYQANAQTIKTQDQVLSTLVNLR